MTPNRLSPEESVDLKEAIRAERDRARGLAVALEQENAEARSLIRALLSDDFPTVRQATVDAEAWLGGGS